MRYTITDFNKQYPDEEACLNDIFTRRYGASKSCPSCKKETTFYRVKSRKSYACQFCGYQIYPLAETVFHKFWFHAIFLFSTSKNGVSAKELQRQLGVTYKTAWRMGHQLRRLMEHHKSLPTGDVEAERSFYGSDGMHESKFKSKQAVL